MYASVAMFGFFIVMGTIGVYAKRLMDDEDQEEIDRKDKIKADRRAARKARRAERKASGIATCVTPGCENMMGYVGKPTYKRCYSCRNETDMC